LVAALAGDQHGVVSRAQLLGLGLTRTAVTHRLAQKRLHRVHLGVYSVGHTVLSTQGRRWAAVLACGDGAVASHATAAAAWDLRAESGLARHVTVLPGNGSRSRPGISVHRTRLAASDVTRCDGLLLTTVARSLVDLGDVARAEQVRRAFVRAEQLRLLDVEEIDAALERAGRRRGPAILRGLLRAYDPRWQTTRSGLELRMLDIVRDHGLPQPEVNAWVAGRWEADLLWARERLILEVDGAGIHGTPSARARDAVRDSALRRLGFRVMHVTEAELASRSAVARRVGRALTPGARGGS
jgi:very-short-patch-repair endonuclease